MLLPKNLPRVRFLLLIPLLLICWLVFLLHQGRPFIGTLSSYAHDKFNQVLITNNPREKFIVTAAKVETPSFEASSLQRECSGGPWPTDLVLRCPPVYGGMTNVRQKILTCVRWAIAWKMAIILPVLRPRTNTNSSRIVHAYTDKVSGFEYLFDQDIFLSRLHEGCPQMTVYENIEAIGTPDKVQFVGKIDRVVHPKKAEMAIYGKKFVEEHRGGEGNISVFDFGNGKLATEYAICNDDTPFAESFGQIVAYREDTIRLAATVLYELNSRFNLNIDPQTAIANDAYLGVHLRTSTDAVGLGWISFEAQTQAYKKYAATYALPVIYVASGNLSSTVLFADMVLPTPVVTKTTLLSGADLELLNTLSWDQQAEVDHLVLLRASRFLGISESGFSWAVASARRTQTEAGTCGWRGTVVGASPTDGLAMQDDLSVIIGKVIDGKIERLNLNLGMMTWP